MTARQGEAPERGHVLRWTPGPGDWVVDAIPAPFPHDRRRRRRLLLIGVAVLATAVATGGVVTSHASSTRPDSPPEVVEQFLAADQRHDWAASWALLCRTQQLEVGSFERYVRVKDETMVSAGLDPADVSVTVAGARERPGSVPRSYLVTFWVGRDGETLRQEMLVVEQDGEFRVCGG